MYRCFLAVLLVLLTCMAKASDDDGVWNQYTIMPGDFNQAGAPGFDAYKIELHFHGKPAPLNLSSHREAKMWRTVLAEAAADGPNFADYMTVARWGCGTECTALAFIDARDGHVYFVNALRSNSSVNIHDDVPLEAIISFRRDSNLLIVAGCPNEECTTRRGINYFIWTGKSLKQIYRVPKGWYPDR